MKAFKNFVAAIKVLRQAATLPDGERAQAAAAARAGLQEWSAEVMVPRMIGELDSGSVDVERAAISALRAAGLDAIEAVPMLMAYFERTANRKNSDVQNYARKEAAYAAEELMRKARQLVEEQERAAKQALQEREQEEQREEQREQAAAARQQRELAPSQEPGWEALMRTVELLGDSTEDPSPDVRIASINALVNLNAPYEKAAPILRARLDDDEARVRVAAANALGRLRPR